MNIEEYRRIDAIGLSILIAQGDLSVSEVLHAACECYRLINPSIHAVIHNQCDNQDLSYRKNQIFSGVPFLFKDTLARKGRIVSCGSQLLQNHVVHHHDMLAQAIYDTGIVDIGTTNMSEFGLQYTTEPELYGATKNPWNTYYSPGGSSGGSAAAVAAGIVPCAHGSDGGGSIRVPASHCGIFGIKPSSGRMPISPGQDTWNSFVESGILSGSVRDAEMMLYLLAGQPADLKKNWDMKSLRIGYCDYFDITIDQEVATAFAYAVSVIKSLGCHCMPYKISLSWSEINQHFFRIVSWHIFRNINDIISKKNVCVQDFLEHITLLCYEFGSKVTQDQYQVSVKFLQHISYKMQHIFNNIHCLITPCTAAASLPIGAFNATNLEDYLEQQHAFAPFTTLFNITGQPAVSIPIVHQANHIPIGVHCVGHLGDESLLLKLASRIEQIIPWRTKLPDISNLIT